jgi:hypothetical protein
VNAVQQRRVQQSRVSIPILSEKYQSDLDWIVLFLDGSVTQDIHAEMIRDHIERIAYLGENSAPEAGALIIPEQNLG